MKSLFVAIMLVAGLCFAPNLSSAQAMTGNITGAIKEASGKPADGATVTLSRLTDSVAVKYELASADGIYKFEGIKIGQYRLIITMMGMLTFKSKPIVVDEEHPLIEIPLVILHSVNKSLNEVVVTAQHSFLQHKIDRTVVNVDALISNSGTTALDVLEKSPGVRIDQGGAISLRGKTGVAVFIDDKPAYLSGSDLENYLRSLPSSSLEQIELMTNPPAKYDAAGNAGIINIKTKKKKVAGFNLGLNLGYRQSRYSSTNNSMDFNFRKNKINIFGNLAYTLRNSYNDVDINRRYFYDAGNYSGEFAQNSYIRRQGDGYKATLGMDLYASEQTTFGVLFIGLIRSPKNGNNSKGKLYNGIGLADSSILSQNNEQGKFKNGAINLNYKHSFRKNGPELSANLDYLKYNTNNDQTFINQNYSAAGDLIAKDQLSGQLPTIIRIYAAKADYSQLLKKGWKLEAGAKSSFTNTNNQANYFNVNGGNATPDYNKTNHFLYKEVISAGYVNLNKDFKRFSIQAGLRLENTDSRGHQLGNPEKQDSAFNRNYTGLFPTMFLLYKLDTLGGHQLKFNYGRRIDRPYYQDLNPFISPLDKYTYYVGNPYLQPSYSGNFELSYIYKNRFTATISYSDTRDRVNETIEIINGYYYDRPGNIGSTKVYGVNVDAGFQPANWLSMQFSADVSHISSRSDFYTGRLDTRSTNYSGQGIVQFKLKKGWNLQMDGNYQSRQTNAQFTLASRGRLNIATAKTISPLATLRLSFMDVLNTGVNRGEIGNLDRTTASFRTLSDTRAVLLTLSLRFGNTVAGQRKHNQTGAGDEQGRVKN